MNTIYHSIRKSDLVESLFKLEDRSSEFTRLLTSTGLPEFQSCVLSLRQTFSEICQIIDEYGNENPERFSPAEIEAVKTQYSTIKNIKEAIEEYFRKSRQCDVTVLGPYKDELAEIEKNLSIPGSEVDLQNHYFIFGESLEPNDVNQLLLNTGTLLQGVPETKFRNIYVLYNKHKFSEDFFREFPRDSFFYPPGIDSKKTEIDMILKDALKRLDEACTLTPKSFSDIITSNEDYERTIAKAKLFSEIDRPLTIIGNTSFEREHFARLIHREGPNKTEQFIPLNKPGTSFSEFGDLLRKTLPYIFAFLNPITIPLVGLLAPIWGARKLGESLGSRQERSEFDDFIKTVRDGTLFIDNVSSLSKEDQYLFQNILAHRKSEEASAEKINKPKLRLIFSDSSMARLNRSVPELGSAISDVVLTIPTLQERGCEDIVNNTIYLIDKINSLLKDKEGKPEDVKLTFRITEDGLSKMCQYSWPGNELELSTFVKSAFSVSATEILYNERGISSNGEITFTEGDITELLNKKMPVDVLKSVSSKAEDNKSIPSENEFSHLYKVDLSSVYDLEKFLNQIEKDYLESAIKKYGMNQTKIGRALGYNQPKVFRRLKALNIH